MLNNDYRRGYNAGYKMGVTSGLKGSSAKCVMEHDLEFIYGTMCLVLKKKYGWDSEKIQDFCVEIQEEWDAIGKGASESNERMSELVERETGVPLRQMTEYVLEAGENE